MRALATCCCLLVPLLSACGETPADLPDVAAAGSGVRVPYDLYGIPGPWWRDDATQADFDRDMWTCRTESKRARAQASSETRKDVAYRAFLDCMTGHAWTRGYPPSA